MIKQGVANTHGYGIVKLMANQLYSLVRRRFVNHIIQMSDRGQHPQKRASILSLAIHRTERNTTTKQRGIIRIPM